MATILNLNDSNPAPLAGKKNVKWQVGTVYTDPTTGLPVRDASAYADDGGVNAQTGTSYTLVAGDNRKLVNFNNASAVAVAITASATLGSAFFCWLENIGAGTVTLTANGSETFDGSGSTLTLLQGQGIMLFSDGSNLFTSRGRGATGSFTAGGDLSGTSSSQTVVGLQGKALDAATVGSPSDGDVVTYDSASGKYKAAAPSGGGTLGTINGGYSYADVPPGSPNAMDDEFNGSSLGPKWSWINQGSATAVVTKGVLVLDNPAIAGPVVRFIKQTLPVSGAWEFTAKITNNAWGSANYHWSGLTVSDGTKTITIGWNYNGGLKFGVWGFNNFTTHGTDLSANNINIFQIGAFGYVKIAYDGATNLTWSYSQDGISWILAASQAATTAFSPSGPTQIGLCCISQTTSGDTIMDVDWFRRTA